jgi:membrane protease YdiL (CAAX protease family)
LPVAEAAPPRPRELCATWAAALGLLVVAKLASLAEPTGLLAGNLAGVGALVFVLLPDRKLQARGETWEPYGFAWWGLSDRRTWAAWGRGARDAALAAALIFPAFAGGFAAFAALLPSLPEGVRGLLAPYALPPAFHLRLPEGLAVQAAVQLLAVALPEELFYRGWMQTSWRRAVPGAGVTVLGARLGPGFLATQALFALGHLATFQPWRLGTFFPGLLFGWLRERTGGLAAPVFLHALSNLFLRVLEVSFYGP